MDSLENMKLKITKARKKKVDAIEGGDLRDKALYIIEHNCTPLAFDCVEASEMSKEQLIKAVDKIYMWAHGACTIHSCYDVHEEWRKNVEDEYEKTVNQE